MIHFNTKRTWGPKPHYPTVLSIKPEQRDMIVIAGPCSIESREQTNVIAQELSRHGCTYMRGGVYRAGTYPPEIMGLRYNLLADFYNIAHKHHFKTVIEVIDIRELDMIDKYADAFQIGARHMQDYALLEELSRTDKPVFLKRNMGATLDEFLGAAEYLVCDGKRNVTLIERGSTTHMNHVRWDLSISLIAAVKQMTGMPIIVDASHGTGRRDLVAPMTLAGIAAGADGFLLEVHPDPEKSLSDADQAYPLIGYGELLNKANKFKNMETLCVSQ